MRRAISSSMRSFFFFASSLSRTTELAPARYEASSARVLSESREYGMFTYGSISGRSSAATLSIRQDEPCATGLKSHAGNQLVFSGIRDFGRAGKQAGWWWVLTPCVRGVLWQ